MLAYPDRLMVGLKSRGRYREPMSSRREIRQTHDTITVSNRLEYRFGALIGKLNAGGRTSGAMVVHDMNLETGIGLHHQGRSILPGLGKQGRCTHHSRKGDSSHAGDPLHDYLQPDRTIPGKNCSVFSVIETEAQASFMLCHQIMRLTTAHGG